MSENPLHPVSILPECDSDEAHCERHEYDMKQIDPVLKWNGAAYTTNKRFSIYYCPACLIDTADMMSKDPEYNYEVDAKRVYKAHIIQMFSMWDDGESPGDWFRYVGEVTAQDGDSFFVTFDGVDNE